MIYHCKMTWDWNTTYFSEVFLTFVYPHWYKKGATEIVQHWHCLLFLNFYRLVSQDILTVLSVFCSDMCVYYIIIFIFNISMGGEIFMFLHDTCWWNLQWAHTFIYFAFILFFRTLLFCCRTGWYIWHDLYGSTVYVGFLMTVVLCDFYVLPCSSSLMLNPPGCSVALTMYYFVKLPVSLFVHAIANCLSVCQSSAVLNCVQLLLYIYFLQLYVWVMCVYYYVLCHWQDVLI